MINRFVSVTGLFLLLFLVVLFPRPAFAQEPTSSQERQQQVQQENQSEDQSQDQMQDSETRDVCPFFGKIAKKGTRFYLQDSIHKQTYLLDDSWLARRHMGTNVLVKGSLDPDSNFIHVRSITNVHSTMTPHCGT
jgi:hypothetical protein